jgi:hypothetical protein
MRDEELSEIINRAATQSATEAGNQFAIGVENLRSDIQQVAEGHVQLARGIEVLSQGVRELTARVTSRSCNSPSDSLRRNAGSTVSKH